ncbi:2711_t:CDS:2 [Funneliformis geosporum]|uniref:4462_t:CDS:1 n=1 Tax=Funneliformis geosporum TaxID=1117311 RepID=A0A9W4SUH5_9GLOM|nr:2711_t:CDS:2 [Funneliformis geosporum]CAI2181361.1 4462_t:CDS:2 [Funneliformis geosporum]
MIDEFKDKYAPNLFDVLLTDLNSKELQQEISERLKISYLSNTLYTELEVVKGDVFDRNLRPFVTIPVERTISSKHCAQITAYLSPQGSHFQEVIFLGQSI